MSEEVRTEHRFEAEVNQVLRLVIHSLYSNPEIFLRELVSNASDALDKLRFRAITEPDLLGDDTLRIRLIPDREAGTLTIEDNGIGMSRDELIEHLGTIAQSGSRAFAEQLAAAKDASGDIDLIGQFGVGFYSAWLVADHVDVLSRAAGSDEAWVWSSDAQETFSIAPAERASRGTSVVLHLREDQKEFLGEYKLRELVRRYSDYVGHPIELQVVRTEKDDDESEPREVTTFEKVNEASALWRRSPEDITDEQYAEFYKHLGHDWEDPMARTHFRIEGSTLFHGLLFVPGRPPFDLFDRDRKHGVRLYVKRVFIMEDCSELLPEWLRFVRGVIDSDDLSLNVSRELLQDSRLTKTIRKQVIKKVLDMLEDMAANRPDDFAAFTDKYGVVLKEGVHAEPKMKERIAKLLRFGTSTGDELTSLAAYIERMPEGQTDIIYALGPNRAMLDASPHLEQVRAKGWEVLYLTDPIDQWVVDALQTFDEKTLVNAMSTELNLGDDDAADDASDDDAKDEAPKLGGLTTRVQELLDEHISEVRVSKRLAGSPACLVVPKGGLAAHIERALRAQHAGLPPQKRILELNPEHPIVKNLERLAETDATGDTVNPWIHMLYDHALITEGSPLQDPARFAKSLGDLLETATTQAVGEA